MGVSDSIFNKFSRSNFLYCCKDKTISIPSTFVSYLFDYLKHLTTDKDSFENNYSGNGHGGELGSKELFDFDPLKDYRDCNFLGYYLTLSEKKKYDLSDIKPTIKIGEKEYNLVELFDLIVEHLPELYLEAILKRPMGRFSLEEEALPKIAIETIKTDPTYRYQEIREKIIARMNALEMTLEEHATRAQLIELHVVSDDYGAASGVVGEELPVGHGAGGPAGAGGPTPTIRSVSPLANRPASQAPGDDTGRSSDGGASSR